MCLFNPQYVLVTNSHLLHMLLCYLETLTKDEGSTKIVVTSTRPIIFSINVNHYSKGRRLSLKVTYTKDIDLGNLDFIFFPVHMYFKSNKNTIYSIK